MSGLHFKRSAVAPCGINCARCKAHLRPINPCAGCNTVVQNRPVSRRRCVIRLCRKRTSCFCCDCAEFPCAKLKQLDKRYRAKYAMSEIENLLYIRDRGIRAFLAKEAAKGLRAGGVVCVHDGRTYAPHRPAQ